MKSYSDLLDLRNAALAEMDASVSSYSTLANQLREGVSYEQAITIVNQFWSVRDAGVMKTRLFTSFPKRNGEIILQSDLDAKIQERIATSVTREFFLEVHAFILTRIEMYLDVFAKLPTEDKLAYHAYLDFRKQVARYLGGVDWGVYELKPILLDGSMKTWPSIPCDESAIENGDYVLWDNLPELIKEAHKTFVYNHLDRKSHINLNSLDWCFDNVKANMEFCVLFASYMQLPVD